MADENQNPVNENTNESTAPESKNTTPSDSSQTTTTPTTGITEEQIQTIRADLTKEVTGEVSKSVIERIGEALGLTKKEEESLPNDPKQLQSIIDKAVERKLSETRSQDEENLKRVAEEHQEKVNGIVTGWYSQYDQLARMGKVPAIKEHKEGDAGFEARKKIIMEIGKMVEKNRGEGIDYTPSIADVLLANPQVLEGVPGGNLPISGNTRTGQSGDSYYYDDIHNRSFQEIAESAMR